MLRITLVIPPREIELGITSMRPQRDAADHAASIKTKFLSIPNFNEAAA